MYILHARCDQCIQPCGIPGQRCLRLSCRASKSFLLTPTYIREWGGGGERLLTETERALALGPAGPANKVLMIKERSHLLKRCHFGRSGGGVGRFGGARLCRFRLPLTFRAVELMLMQPASE